MGTNQKHTPGPWEVRHESADPEWSVVVASGGRIVANINAETGPDIPPLTATKMPKEANARLISAAPDLLAALEELLVERYALEEPEEFDENGHWTSTSPASVKARAAILKAKGEA
jgi:hypothetical protein